MKGRQSLDKSKVKIGSHPAGGSRLAATSAMERGTPTRLEGVLEALKSTGVEAGLAHGSHLPTHRTALGCGRGSPGGLVGRAEILPFSCSWMPVHRNLRFAAALRGGRAIPRSQLGRQGSRAVAPASKNWELAVLANLSSAIQA